MGKTILLKRSGYTTYLYFVNHAHHPNPDEVDKAIKLAIYKNQCSSANIKLSHGIIELNFNPTQQKFITRRQVEMALKKMIANS